MDIPGTITAIAALIAALGGAAGGVAAYLAYLDNKPQRRREKIEKELEQERQEIGVAPVPVLGRIIWSRTPTTPTDLPYAATKRVITVGNFKGGVGKTTLSANLAAYFAEHENKRVLLIDFDYQGSLSYSCARLIGARRNTYSSAKLIAPSPSMQELRNLALPLTNEDHPSKSISQIDLFTAFYPLDIQETQQLIEWFNNGVTDVRYRLRDVLASPEFNAYEVVVIDSPPRFSTGTINALCASTHLVVPTILDLLSSEAVTYFAQQLQELRPTIFPHLKFLGVVPTMVTPGRTQLTNREDRVAERINAEVRRILGGDSWVLKDAAVPRLAAIMNVAGEGVAYVMDNQAKAVFDNVGAKLSRSMS